MNIQSFVDWNISESIKDQIKEFPNSFTVVGTWKVKVLEWVSRKGFADPKKMEFTLMSGDRINITDGNKPGRKAIQLTAASKLKFYVDERTAKKIEEYSR